MTTTAVDLFAGPGGWDVACDRLGIGSLGIEFDDAAVRTRQAYGLPTIHGDVRDYGPAEFPWAEGLIASPPCQTFSMAGNGAGRKALDKVFAGIDALAAGEMPPAFDDERTGLVLEPLRWALDGDYRWLAFEQVPAVLPVWEKMAEVLRSRGYSVATGILNAEQYGVPQTRRRAILVAKLGGPVELPTPTHSRYYNRNPQQLDLGVKPWVSMTEALGGLGAEGLRSNYGTGGDAANRGFRAAGSPAPTLTGKADRNKWVYRAGKQKNATHRTADLPAPTLAFGHDYNSAGWVAAPGCRTAGGPSRRGERALAEPSATVTRKADRGRWKWEDTPSTTITGDPRITAREHHYHGEQNSTSFKLTVEEATVLQTFPADFPWQGTKGKQFQQIGNAIPPLLAEAVLAAVIA